MGKKNQRRLAALGLTTLCPDGRKAPRQGLSHHHHAWATAKRAVIHPAVVAVGVVARVPQAHIDLAAGIGTPGHTARQEGREQLGKRVMMSKRIGRGS